MTKAEVLEALDTEMKSSWAFYMRGDLKARWEYQAYFEGYCYLKHPGDEPLALYVQALMNDYLETENETYLHVLRLYETLDDVPLGVLD